MTSETFEEGCGMPTAVPRLAVVATLVLISISLFAFSVQPLLAALTQEKEEGR